MRFGLKYKMAFIGALCGMVAFLPVSAQSGESFCSGKLDNGLTYYLRHTDLQPEKADFYLVQNVGALMEDGHQNGLAHFLEHMAFNATETFPQGVDRFMQDHSVTSYNAYTAHNETVYSLENIPTGQAGFTDSCMLVLRDWCRFLLLPEKGIQKERGIITEEWRRGRTPLRRVMDTTNRYLYNGSKYAVHDAIGQMNIIQNFKRDELVSYYRDWYRPELQAVIIVGDIDIKYAEDFIIREFGRIPATLNGRVREKYTIPENATPLYCRVVEPGLESVDIELLQRIVQPEPSPVKEEQVKRMIVKQFYNDMLAGRLAKLGGEAGSNIQNASAAYEELVRGYDCHTISLNPLPGSDFRALSEVFETYEKILRFGFTSYEFDFQKNRLLRQLSGFEKNMDKLRNEVYVSAYRYHFLENIPVIEPEERNRLTRICLEKLTVEDVNRWIHTWSDQEKNRVFIVAGSDKDYDYLTKEDIVGAWEDVRDSELEPEVFDRDTLPMIDFDIVPGRIVKEKTLPVGDAREWTMSNGATVIFKATGEGSGRVELLVQSAGGLSLLPVADLPSGSALNSLVLASGVYHFDKNRLQEMFQEREQSLAFSLQELGEVIQGTTTTAEARSFFELLYLSLVKPRFDETEFSRYINELQLSLEANRSPLEAVGDSINRLFMAETPRIWKFDTSYIRAVNFDKVKEIYKDRFGDAADFVFYIVGDLDETEARELACRYIGSLPAAHGKEKYAVYDFYRKSGHVQKEYQVDLPDNKALIELTYRGDFRMNRQEAVTFWMFGTILKSRCIHEIREKRGATYNIDVATSYTDIPVCSETLTISFETEKGKTEELREWLKNEIAGMAAGSADADDIRSIAAAQKQIIASQPKGIRYWTDAVRSYHEKKMDKTSPHFHHAVLDAITPVSMSKLMTKFLRKAQVADIVIKSTDDKK